MNSPYELNLSFFFIPVHSIFPDHLPDIIKMQIISRTVGANHFIIISYYHAVAPGSMKKKSKVRLYLLSKAVLGKSGTFTKERIRGFGLHVHCNKTNYFLRRADAFIKYVCFLSCLRIIITAKGSVHERAARVEYSSITNKTLNISSNQGFSEQK